MPTFDALFRVMGQALEPGEVSRLLALEPSSSHEEGGPRIGKSGRRYGDYTESLWSLTSGIDESASLDEHLAALGAKLAGKGEVIGQLLELGFRVDIFVGVFGNETGNLGFSISAPILRDLGNLGIELDFDVYD